jgi:zinc protease
VIRAASIGSVLFAVAACCPPPAAAPVTPVAPVAGATTQTPPAPPAVTGPVPAPWESSGIAWDRVPEPGPEPTFAPPVPAELRLANGVRVLVVENHRLPLVSIRVVNMRAGSREDAGKLGLAALTGDLLDEGAGTLTALTLPEELERLGADLDVAVGADYAVVSLDTLGDTLEPSLGVLADVVLRPQLTQADFDRIKADRIADLKLRPDSPRRVANLVFERTVFGAHPYGAPGAGFVASVEKLTLADAKRFWKTWYVPSEATVIVSGDVDRATLVPLLEKTLGTWKGARPAPAKRAKAPAATAPRLVVVDRPDAPQSVVVIGRLGADVTDPAYFPAEVANTAIGGSFASRLNNRLREQLGYTYGIFSSFWRGGWSGTWSVVSSIKTEVTIEGIKEALAIIDRTRKEALPADELAKAKQLLTRAQPQDFETNASIAGVYQGVVVAGRPLDWPATWAGKIREVDADDARGTVDKAWDGLAIVVVGDWKKLGDGLTKLGLPITHVDAEAKPKPPAK